MKHYEYVVVYIENGVKSFYKIFDIVALSSIDALNQGHSRFIKSMNGDNIFRIKCNSYIILSEKIRLVRNYSQNQ